MTARDFVYWAMGYFELSEPGQGMTAKQVDLMRRHLALVFKHEIDPSIDGGDDGKKAELGAIHAGKPDPLYGPPHDNLGLKMRC